PFLRYLLGSGDRLAVAHRDADLILREAGALELIDRLLSLSAILKNAYRHLTCRFHGLSMQIKRRRKPTTGEAVPASASLVAIVQEGCQRGRSRRNAARCS